MNCTTEELNEFNLAGISVKTTGADNQAQKDMIALFKKFIDEEIIDKIPNKLTYEVYCVYSDYETDSNGPHKIFIGCKVDSFENLPEQCERKTVPAGKYMHCKAGENLRDAWEQILECGIKRAYTADMEVYGDENDEDGPESRVYVSIK